MGKPQKINMEGGNTRLQSAVIRESKRSSAVIKKPRPFTGAVRGAKNINNIFNMHTMS